MFHEIIPHSRDNNLIVYVTDYTCFFNNSDLFLIYNPRYPSYKIQRGGRHEEVASIFFLLFLRIHCRSSIRFFPDMRCFWAYPYFTTPRHCARSGCKISGHSHYGFLFYDRDIFQRGWVLRRSRHPYGLKWYYNAQQGQLCV